MKTFKQYLTESPLGPSELDGVHGKTKELRIDILTNLIKSNTPLRMVKKLGYKKDLFLVTDKELALNGIDQFKRDRKSFAIGVIDDKPVMSNHILKSKKFGGEISGAGGGTLNTAITESAQCLWCAAMLGESHNNPIEYFTDEVLTSYWNKVKVGGTKLKDVLSISDKWKESAYLSAKLLIDKGFIVKGHVFHRDSVVMKGIYLKKKKAFKNSDMPNLKDDKWNPSDIYAVASTFNLTDLNDSTLLDLNSDMLQNYANKTCVGISLKEVKKSASFKEYNLELPPQVSDHSVKSVSSSSKKGSFWDTMAAEIIYDEGIASIRRNKAMGSNKLEIKMKNARGGSISWGPIEDNVEVIFGKGKIPSNSDLSKLAKAISPRKGTGKSKDIKTFYDLAFSLDKTIGSFKSFVEELSKKDAGWVKAKLGGLYFIYLLKSDTKKGNRLITKCINYAASKAEDSSVFVKVY